MLGAGTTILTTRKWRKEIMGEIDDLKNADVKMKHAVADILAGLKSVKDQLTALQNQPTPISAADVESVAQDVSNMADQLEAAVKPAAPAGA
jgi:hypothetical protein